MERQLSMGMFPSNKKEALSRQQKNETQRQGRDLQRNPTEAKLKTSDPVSLQVVLSPSFSKQKIAKSKSNSNLRRNPSGHSIYQDILSTQYSMTRKQSSVDLTSHTRACKIQQSYIDIKQKLPPKDKNLKHINSQ